MRDCVAARGMGQTDLCPGMAATGNSVISTDRITWELILAAATSGAVAMRTTTTRTPVERGHQTNQSDKRKATPTSSNKTHSCTGRIMGAKKRKERGRARPRLVNDGANGIKRAGTLQTNEWRGLLGHTPNNVAGADIACTRLGSMLARNSVSSRRAIDTVPSSSRTGQPRTLVSCYTLCRLTRQTGALPPVNGDHWLAAADGEPETKQRKGVGHCK